jgi:hypothetical protein
MQSEDAGPSPRHRHHYWLAALGTARLQLVLRIPGVRFHLRMATRLRDLRDLL